MKRIIYQNEDGGVSVVIPADPTEINDIAKQVVPKGVAFQIVSPASLPKNRRFRDAWVMNGKVVGIDLVKAKDILHTKRRLDRDTAFEPLDRMATVPAMAAKAETQRQVIRDADAVYQTAIDSTKTVAELEVIAKDY